MINFLSKADRIVSRSFIYSIVVTFVASVTAYLGGYLKNKACYTLYL